MTRPVVGVDVDGVLVDMLGQCFLTMEKMFGKKLTHSDMNGWCIDHHLEGRTNDFWTELGASGFHENTKPYPGAVEGIQKLREVADVYIVTSPLRQGKTWTYDRDRWLQEHFGFDFNDIIHMRAKHRFLGDALVDDRPENILQWQKVHTRGKGIVWRHSWNQTPGTYEAHSWDDVIRLVTDER